MIDIVYDREGHRLTLKGHANRDEHGRDIVCSAATMLTMTLARAVEELDGKGYLDSYTVRLETGDAEIVCAGEKTYLYKLMFDMIALGFGMLAEEYPENISFVRA